MALDIEVEFMYSNAEPIETTICIMCDRRPIRAGGISKCQVCSDMTIAKRMNTAFDYENAIKTVVDESDPDIVDYIKHNVTSHAPLKEWELELLGHNDE